MIGDAAGWSPHLPRDRLTGHRFGVRRAGESQQPDERRRNRDRSREDPVHCHESPSFKIRSLRRDASPAAAIRRFAPSAFVHTGADDT